MARAFGSGPKGRRFKSSRPDFQRDKAHRRSGGGLFPFPDSVRVSTGRATVIVNEQGAPWRRGYGRWRRRTTSATGLAFGVRDDLMTAATLSDRPDVLLVAFSRCLAQYHRNGGRGTRTLKVRLPDGPPKPGVGGRSDVRELGARRKPRAEEIARRFDARNGTGSFQRQIDDLPELLRLAAD